MPFDSSDGYDSLKQARARYEKYIKHPKDVVCNDNEEANDDKVLANSDWPFIPDGEKIKVGLRDERIPLLRERLYREDYLDKNLYKSQTSEDPLLFDPLLDEALKKFQATHGLLVDGELGGRTLKALNVSPAKRLCQIDANLARLQNSILGADRQALVVNIPEFQLHIYELDKEVKTMRVITGQRDKQTPIFNDMMEYIVVNPKWHVPQKIAIKEELREIRKNPSDYFIKKEMQLYQIDAEGNRVEVDPATVDWLQVNSKKFPYELVQRPGDGNALGTIKFLFPNKNDVYLHDTPNHSLFMRADRALSHGCVRVEDPLGLAEYLFKDNRVWTVKKIKELIGDGTEHLISLKTPVPVYLIYQTAWVDSTGTLQLRDDLYKLIDFNNSFNSAPQVP